MYTKASIRVINVAEHIKLGVVLAEDAEKFHTDTAEELFICLMQVHRCNAFSNTCRLWLSIRSAMPTATLEGTYGLSHVSLVYATLTVRAMRSCSRWT